jgi:hypothetical protein
MKLIERESDKENACCPELCVVDCADTQEHKHLLCGFSNTILTNQTIRNLCIENFGMCVSDYSVS